MSLALCQCSQTPDGGADPSTGGAVAAGGAVATGGMATTGGTLGSGGGDGGADSSCPSFACAQDLLGGRGNVCGGVVMDSRFLSGSSFEQIEGARVVTLAGEATIEDGAFSVPLGLSAGCPPKPAAYRIDMSANGHCDDGVDLIYVAKDGMIDLQVSGDARGTPATCAEFPDGFDLEFEFSAECLPRCGNIRSALFDGTGSALSETDTLFLDAASLNGHAFAGLVKPGRDYVLRYYWGPRGIAGQCLGSTDRVLEHPFTGSEGANRLELALTLASSQQDCF